MEPTATDQELVERFAMTGAHGKSWKPMCLIIPMPGSAMAFARNARPGWTIKRRAGRKRHKFGRPGRSIHQIISRSS
jgi:hypothetical protein